jgi:hypothetical protein
MSRTLDGWQASERRLADGSIETAQRVLTTRLAVEPSDGGARSLGSCYWLEVTRASHGLVRCRESETGVELRLLGFGPPLLDLGPAEVAVETERVSCRYPIRGGLLARRAGGAISVAQIAGERPELCVAVTGFFARLGVRPGFPRWSGTIYEQIQRRVHVAISRRFFKRLLVAGPL